MTSRVLFLAGNLNLGGAEMVVRTLAAGLDRSRFEPHIGLVSCRGSFLDDVPSDTKIHDLACGRSRYASIPIARLCWRLRPVTVFSSAAHVNSALILARPLLPRGVRVLVRESANITMKGVSTSLRRFLYKHLYRRADAVICQSNDMLRQLQNSFGVPPSQLVRIYNPVDVRKIRQKAQISANPYDGPGPHLVAVGRLSYPKGFDILLAAMPLVARHVPTVDLTIVGEGPEEGSLRNLVCRLNLGGVVRFAGLQRNPFGFLKHADLVVAPSRYDALSNVVLEAVALAKPVLTSDCPGGIREIAEVTRRVRFISGSGSEALIPELIRAVNDRGWRAASEVEPTFMQRFSIHEVMPQYELLFSEGLSPQAAGLLHSRSEPQMT
jgi:glycosyltransferase involved in cell wall biosynthesis